MEHLLTVQWTFLSNVMVHWLVILIILFSLRVADALVVGSNTAPSRQAAVTFPAIDSNNIMLGFAAFANGFTLGNNTTTCTYNNFFPVSGTVSLRGGRLHLRKDLVFDLSLNITTSGSIFAASNSITFGKLIPDLNLTSTLTFDTANVVFVNGATLSSLLQFRNSCKINALGKRLTFKPAAQIVVRPGGNLIIENAELWGLQKNNLRCMTDRGALTLRNCTLLLSQDYTFSRGSILFIDDVMITGTNKFIYSSGLTSTIASATTVFLDNGITFSYNPRIANSNLIFMTDDTSYFYLNGCTLHSTRTGLRLTSGTVLVDDKVTFSSEGRSISEAFYFDSNLSMVIKGRGTASLYGLIRYA